MEIVSISGYQFKDFPILIKYFDILEKDALVAFGIRYEKAPNLKDIITEVVNENKRTFLGDPAGDVSTEIEFDEFDSVTIFRIWDNKDKRYLINWNFNGYSTD